MAAKKEADLSAAKDAFGGFTDQSDDPTKGAGQSIDDVVAKLMAEQEKLSRRKKKMMNKFSFSNLKKDIFYYFPCWRLFPATLIKATEKRLLPIRP